MMQQLTDEQYKIKVEIEAQNLIVKNRIKEAKNNEEYKILLEELGIDKY